MAQSNEGYAMVNQQTNSHKGVFGRKISQKVHKKEAKVNSSLRRAKSTTAVRSEEEPHCSAPHLYYNWRDGGAMRRIPDTIREEGPEMTLTKFAAKYQNSLPQQVLVTRGMYCEEDEDSTVASSERLNIHFVRHRESVSTRINNNKQKHFKNRLNAM